MRFPCFDGLRAFAALSVIGVHTTFESGLTARGSLGNYTSRLEIGVEVFFVISGFLLYRPFAKAHFTPGNKVDVRRFWVRRLKRIIPAYWLAFLVITYVMHADKVRHQWYSIFIYLGFAQIYTPYYILSGIGQAWSLCTEMSFYFMLPLYALLMGRRRGDPATQLRREITGLAGLVVISYAWRIPVLSAHSGMARTMPNWLPAYLDVFALGMLLAVVSAYLAQQERRPDVLWHPAVPGVSWALAAGCFVIVANIGLNPAPVAPNPILLSLARQVLYGLFGFFMVAPAVFGPQDRGIIRKALQWRPVALIGVVSYGVYLWHEAWIQMFFSWTGDRLFGVPFLELFLSVSCLAIASASVSYVLVEKPILQGKLPSLPRAILPPFHFPTSSTPAGSVAET